MTFFNCVADAIDEGSMDKAKGERMQEYWRTFRERHRRSGHSDEMADHLAGEDAKAAMRKEFGEERQRFIATRVAMRRSEALVENAADLPSLGENRIEFNPNAKNRVTPLAQQADGLFNRVRGRMSDLAYHYGPKMLTGKEKDPAGSRQLAKEIMGEPTGNTKASLIAKAVSDTFEDLRRMANEAGANIGKIDNYMPQAHDRMAIAKAGFDSWFSTTAPKLDWHRIEDYLTGRPMAPEGGQPPIETQREFLLEIYNNLSFGKESGDPAYGKISGESIVRRMNAERVLQFKSAEDWIDYNAEFGAGDVFSAILQHARSMSEDIVTMREFGASWRLGLDYERQLAVAKAREAGDTNLASKIEKGYENAELMLSIRRGGRSPKSWQQARRASWFASGRSWITSSLLEKAIIPSLSDFNSGRIAAQTFEANPTAPFVQAMKFMFNKSSRNQLFAMRRSLDHLFQNNSVSARMNAEAPPAGFVNNLSNAVFRYIGLSGLTENGRYAIKHIWHAKIAEFAGQSMDDLPDGLRRDFVRYGITPEDWAEFSSTGSRHYVDENGVKYLDPVFWRELTDIDPSRADDLFLKFEALSEEWSEMGVPSQSLFAQAKTVGRIGLDREKGDIGYEFAASVRMFKSFVMAMTTNQARAIMATNRWRVAGVGPEFKGNTAKIARFADMMAGYTALGMLSIQIGDMLMGSDPADMTDPEQWWRAMMKGGGLGILGDAMTVGNQSLPGAIGSYVVGPVGDLGQDALQFSVGNSSEFLANLYRVSQGDDWKRMKVGTEAVDLVDDWTPNDFPVIGTVIDRLMMDNLKMLLDPDSVDDIARAARSGENYRGSKYWWTPGKAVPERAPNLGAAFGL